MTVEEFRNEWYSDTPYVVAHTSGSTGIPKEIHLQKSDMRASAEATNRYFGIGPDSVLAIPLSMDYIAGKMMAVRSFIAGCRLVELPVSNTIDFRHHVDLLAIVPSQVRSMLENCDLSGIGNVIIGGAPLPDNERIQLSATTLKCFCTYGMTETCSHVALADVKDRHLTYRAMPGVSFDTDSRGCLKIFSQTMSFGVLQTNDVVELIDDSAFRWCGRADNVINSGGIKILAEELEESLACVIDVPFYITGAADEKWGEVPQLVAEAPESMQAELQAAVDSLCLGKRRPRSVVCVDKLSRTSNGKIRRLRL